MCLNEINYFKFAIWKVIRGIHFFLYPDFFSEKMAEKILYSKSRAVELKSGNNLTYIKHRLNCCHTPFF